MHLLVSLMFSPIPPSQIGEAVVDFISDLLVAIILPVLVLTYRLATFQFDRATQELVADLFPHWSFQNAARVLANPEQTIKIFKSLQGLRFQSVGVWIARMGNTFGLLISLRRLVRLLRAQMPQKLASNPNSKSTKSDSNRSGSSNVAWNCPCRGLIDADLSPANISVWKDPPDATAIVSNLTASGDLEILQIINRRLEQLLDTLLRCSQLEHIATITLPLWAAEFTNLEFLHIPGKARNSSLVSLPQGLFVTMKKLTFVHLGAHVGLQQLPNVAGLTNLRSITMARMALEALPADFAQLEPLEIIMVLMMPGLKTFPDLSRGQGALKMLLIDACPLCCNGFMQNGCDLAYLRKL